MRLGLRSSLHPRRCTRGVVGSLRQPPPAGKRCLTCRARAGTYDVNVLVAGRGATGVPAFRAPPPRQAAAQVQA